MDHVPETMSPTENADRVLESIGNLLRGFCLVGVFLLLLFGVYQSIAVFKQVGRLVTEPAALQGSVDQIAELIQAESFEFTQGPNVIKFGRAASVLILLICYFLWMWIPLAIISACSRILLVGLAKRKSTGR
ncbi:MAG: hypothetical protein R3E01_19050 [Pirellulaceae bacterium]|nr:hypothetical protein [Planctomycetales bacterium]